MPDDDHDRLVRLEQKVANIERRVEQWMSSVAELAAQRYKDLERRVAATDARLLWLLGIAASAALTVITGLLLRVV